MDNLCKVSDKDVIENESKYYHYMATLAKEYDKSFYENYSINNSNLDEIDEIPDDYTTSHNRKFIIYFIKC